MRIVKPSWKILNLTSEIIQQELLKIEFAYRECYKSEGKMTSLPDKGFIRNKIAMHHLSPLEHSSVTVEIICDRGVSHELVRHRIASYSQESTRYCNYNNSGLEVIEPFFWTAPGVRNNTKYNIWLQAMTDAEKAYVDLILNGASPQEARSVLPNSTKTAIVVTQNLRQWRHFFQLRALGTTGKPHPQMLEIAVPMFEEFKRIFVPVFDDMEVEQVEIFDENGKSIGVTGNRGPQESYQGAEETHVDIINMMYDGMEKSIRDINTDTWEGKLLLVALAWLSGSVPHDKTHPDELLNEINEAAKEVFPKK